MNKFPNKAPAEKLVLTYDFTNELAGDEFLTGEVTVKVTLLRGVDANPAAIQNGLPQVESKRVLVPIKGGFHNCIYQVEVVAVTNNPRKVLSLAADLPVVD
jgi:hypothetical protein